MIAIGAMHAGYDVGITIPDELSILGYDDIPTASHILPKLSTIAQPIEKMGEIAAQTLLDHMSDPNAPIRSITLENNLKIRSTTAHSRIDSY
jgi:DNA-binding LacI/PurR family transcriptional regulator